jgi:hypothetical protein
MVDHATMAHDPTFEDDAQQAGSPQSAPTADELAGTAFANLDIDDPNDPMASPTYVPLSDPVGGEG